MPDTVSASTSSTVTVTVGTPLNGEIETPYDEDWYRVALTANITYTIRLVGRGTGSNTLEDPFIDGIYNSNGDYVGGFNNDGLISGPYGRDAMTTFRPTSSGNYWIAAMGDSGTIGTFTISVTDSSGTTDSVLATTATTATVNVGGSVTGTIDTAGDVDWYRVSLTSGATYTIRLLGLTSNAGSLADPVIEGIYSSSGAYIPNTYIDDFTTRDAVLTFAAPSSGNYYIAARGWNTYTGTFRLEVASDTADIAGDASTTGALAVGASTPVRFGQPYDHDWYAVSLVAGRTYEFKLSGTGFDNTTPFIHGIFNSSGQYVGSYAGTILGVGSASATTIFTPTTSGTYYIDTFSIYEGTYTLSAQQAPDNDIPANTTTTASVTVNGPVVAGHIGGATDIDWYKVSLAANTTYVITMRGAQNGNGTLEDPIIAGIYDASGVIVPNTFADDTSGRDASLIFRPTASGTYYIATDGYASYTGTFGLSVNTLSVNAGQGIANAGSVALNTPTTVNIQDAAETPWYSVNLTGGSTYGIRLMGAATNRGTLYDPVLVGVYDGNGVLVSNTYVDDARGLLDSILQFTPTSTGTYYIVADGYDRFTGTARLTVSIDNIGTTNATAGVLTAGTPVEGVIDYGGDVDRYKVSLDANSTYYVRMLGYFSRNGDLADPHISGVFFGTSSTDVGVTIVDASGADPVIGTDAWVRVATGANGGDYYIASTGNGSTDGAYLLTADKDVAGSQATTATVSVGGSVTSFIDEGTDADWFAVSLTAGTSYVIKMQGSQYGNGTLVDPYINGVRLSTTPTTIISGTSGTTIDNNDGRDSVVRFVAATTGTYYIAAQSSGTIVGSYRISVNTDVGENAATSAVLPINGSVVGSIDDTNDTDWYAITVVANTSYVFKMLGVDSGAGTLDDPLIANIVNSGGSAQTGVSITSAGLDSYARWIPGTSGTYYIRATGGGTDTGTFTMSAVAEVGHTSTTAGSVAVGGTAVGSIDAPGDSDWYAVNLLANTSYMFKMEGADSGGGTLGAAVIGGILNASGAAQSGVTITSAGSDSYARWITGASGGTFYIDATSTGRSMGSFTLTVATEIGHTAASAAPLTVGTPVSGSIDVAGDSDWYAITVAANTSYVFKMEGTDSGFGTLSNATIGGILNSSGAAQANVTITSAGSDSYARWVPTGSGTFYINATGTGNSMGTFRLSALTEVGHTTASASSFTVGAPANGRIDMAGDSDWYGISLAANTAYIFKMQGVDGVAIGGIMNSSGAAQADVTISSSGTDSYARWVSGTAGTYYINATGAQIGNFTLTASTADVGHTTATASSFTVSTPASGMIDMPNDSDWYGVSLAANTAYIFTMQGPDGVAIGGIMNSTGTAQTGVTISSSGAESYARWVSGTAGTYYINATGTSIGSFTLRASTGDVGHTTATASSFTVSTPASGTVDMPDDSDWYAISLTANTSYLFRLQGVDGVAIGGIMNSTGTAQAGVTISASGTESYATWIPGSTGVHYINVTGKSIGAFSLSASTETGNTTASYDTIAVGGTANGTIDLAGDSDWYRISLGHSTSYAFRISGVSSGGGTLADPHIVLRNSSGAAVASGFVTSEHGTDTVIRFTTTASGTTNAGGTYYIDAQGNGTAGTFRLTAATEPGTNSTTAGAITLGTPFVGMIEDTSDADWYAITVTANTPYVFRMLGADSGGGTLGGAVITSIVNSSGTVQSGVSIASSGSDAYATWTPTANGTFYINVTASGTNTGTFTLSASTDAVGTTGGSAASLPANGTVTGTVDVPGDSDWYAITVTAHTPYVFRMLGADSGGGTLGGAAIAGIVTSGGVAQTGVSIVNSGSDSYATWTPAAGGTFYINVTGSGANSGTFTLSSGTDAVGTTATSAATLPITGSVNGTIDVPGDNDWYSIAVTANTAYIFKMEGVDGGGGTLGGAAIAGIVSSAGAAQSGVTITTSGSDSYARWIPTASGTFYINASSAGANSGTFRLSSITEVGHTTASYDTITVGGTANGTIDMPDDSDWYRFTHNTGTGYVIRLSGAGSGGGTLATPILNGILTSTGTALTNEVFFTDGTDAFMRWSPTSSTTPSNYFIDVGGGGVGTFTLTIEQEAGDTAAGAWTLPLDGSVNGTIGDSTDTDWYKIALAGSTTYAFRINGASSGNGTLAAPTIVLRNSTGTEVTSNVTTSTDGTDTIIVFRTGFSGATYHLDVQGNGTVGTYTLSSSTETGASTTSYKTFTLGTPDTDSIDQNGDTDWYRVSLATNTSYVFRMQGVDSGNGTLEDPELVLRNSSGTAINTNVVRTSEGNDAIIRFTVSSATTYYIDAQGAGTIGTYTLTGVAEPGTTNATSHAVTVGTPVMGELSDTDDVDRYSVSLNANTNYRIRMEGLDSGNGTLADPWINGVRSSGGAVVVNATEGGGIGNDAWVTYRPTQAGTYYIDADTSADAVGTYKLTVEIF